MRIARLPILLAFLLLAGALFFSTGPDDAIDSIAVLPLDNFSNDPEQDYFVAGMHEALIAELAQIEALMVISRTSVNRYRDTEKSIPEIARELNVDVILEGSVLRAGDSVRITVQLIGTEPERHLWAQSYDGDLRDVLSLHSQVARAVAKEIQVAVTPEEEARLASARQVDPEVYQHYLLGRQFCSTQSESELYRGVDQFRQAIDRDPGYAPAHAGLARCYSTLAMFFLPSTTSSNPDTLPRIDWRVSSDVTLNLGVRYDFNRPVYEAQDRFSVPDLDNPDGGFIPVGTQGIPRAGYDADTNNVAPRLGVAWTPFGSSSSVVRAGYGVYNDTGILNVNIVPRYNPPFFSLDVVSDPASLTDAFSGAALPKGFVAGIDPNYRDGYYHQFSAGVQHEPAPHLLVDVAYVGSRGRNLQAGLDPNQGPPGGPPVRNPAFGPALLITSRGSSAYDSLQIRVERRFVNGLSFLSAYTWSRSRDNGSAWLSFATALPSSPQNSSNLDAEFGPSEFDSPHRWVLSYIWELPFGSGKPRLNGGCFGAAILGNWELAGITTFQSGRPFSAYYGVSANFSGTSNGANGGFGLDRPNQVGDPEVPDPDPSLWFNPQAFASPDNTFGNVGRNTLRGAGIRNFDVALYKNLRLGEDKTIQLRVELFNAFNTPHFFLPVNDLTNANAGRVLGANDSRQIQFGLKFNY